MIYLMDDDHLNRIRIECDKQKKPSTLNTIQPTRLLERQLPFLCGQKTKQEQKQIIWNNRLSTLLDRTTL